MSDGFYLWGRVSSFADCARIKPTGQEAVVCPAQPIVDRTPPGNYVWHAPYVHSSDLNSIGGPVTYAEQPAADQTSRSTRSRHSRSTTPKTVFFDTMLSFGFPRIAYPGAGTTYYYNFHLHYVTAKYNMLPPDNPATSGFPAAPPTRTGWPTVTRRPAWCTRSSPCRSWSTSGWCSPTARCSRVIFLVGLGGVLSVTAAGGAARTRIVAAAGPGAALGPAELGPRCTGRRAARRCCPGSPPSPCS